MDSVKHWSYTGTDVKGFLYGCCQMFGCKSSARVLQKWKTTLCEKHPPYLHDVGTCTCRPPFIFYSFPKDPVKREMWIARVNRKGFKVSLRDRICSRHFVDEEVTEKNFYPTKFLGYKLHRRLTAGRKPPKDRSLPNVPVSKAMQSCKPQLQKASDQSKL